MSDESLGLFNGGKPNGDIIQDIAEHLTVHGYPTWGPCIVAYSKELEQERDALKAKLAEVEKERDGFKLKFEAQQFRIAELEERLELTAENGVGELVKIDIGECDGIACRDETIKWLEGKEARLAAKLAEVEKERDALKATIAYMDARIGAVTRLLDAEREEVASRNNDVAEREVKLARVEKERDALKSKQTRWVKCSERLPTIPKDYPCVIEGMVSGVLGREYIFGSLSDDGKLLPNEHIAPQWKIVAWLEGMPEYVP